MTALCIMYNLCIRDFTVAALPANNIELHIYTLLIPGSICRFENNDSAAVVVPFKLKDEFTDTKRSVTTKKYNSSNSVCTNTFRYNE
jgi:hypothetical protein